MYRNIVGIFRRYLKILLNSRNTYFDDSTDVAISKTRKIFRKISVYSVGFFIHI